jgi:hypothetical protein
VQIETLSDNAAMLRSAERKGYGTDVVAVLCHYGFVVREVLLGLLAQDWKQDSKVSVAVRPSSSGGGADGNGPSTAHEGECRAPRAAGARCRD